MKVSIRKCSVEDYVHIALINRFEMGYDYSKEHTKKKLEELLNKTSHKIYVATVDKKVVGYIHGNNYDLLYAPSMKNIMGIAVLNDFKNNGIGKMLLNSIEKWAKETGACGIRLVSGAKRVGAHEFYIKCGYRGNKEQRNFIKVF